MSAEQWVMVIEGTAIEMFEERMFLAAFDVEVPDDAYGWGSAWLTPNADEAMVFDSVSAVMETWKTQSTTMPLRPRDGKPNRPLTRYTIQPMRLEEARTGVDYFGEIRRP